MGTNRIKKYDIGTMHESKDGNIFEVIEKIGYTKRKIRFSDLDIEKTVSLNSIKNKSIRTTSYKINVGELYNNKEVHEIIIKGVNYGNKNVNNILYTVNENGCWECFSHPKGGGRKREYIVVSIKGSSDYLHRASYLTYKGDITKGLEVMHICDNPICCNPEHLRLGTHKENNEDKINKNRQLKGTDIVNSILNEEDVLKIISLWNQGLYENDIAKLFNVSRNTINAIKRGKIWSHVTGIKYDENVFKNKRAKLQSGEVGVKWSEMKNRWIVVLKGKHIGTYKTLEEAIESKYNYLKEL